MGIISFSGSKTENLLYTGSGGTQFTHCGLQNPLLLPLTLAPLRSPPQSQPIQRRIGPPVPATQAVVPTALPHSLSECQMTEGILRDNFLVSCIEDISLVARLRLGLGLCPSVPDHLFVWWGLASGSVERYLKFGESPIPVLGGWLEPKALRASCFGWPL